MYFGALFFILGLQVFDVKGHGAMVSPLSRNAIGKEMNWCLFISNYVKFIYSEMATKFCEISTLLLSYVVPVKSKVEISQNFVAFSEYMNFNRLYAYLL